MEIILASKSPRRKELLRKITTVFSIEPSKFNEAAIKEKDPLKFVITAAEEKAKEVSKRHPNAIVIGADTVISFKDKIYGKPKDINDANKTLNLFSGKEHKVITGVAICKKDENKLLAGIEITDITFNKLSKKDIEEYTKKNNVLDKAGSYAIQEIGDKFIKEIKGDYDNVVGFPVKLVKSLIGKFTSV